LIRSDVAVKNQIMAVLEDEQEASQLLLRCTFSYLSIKLI